MTLAEAVKSGKPFRRKGWHNKIYIVFNGIRFEEVDNDTFDTWAHTICTSPVNFLEDDWEVREEKK